MFFLASVVQTVCLCLCLPYAFDKETNEIFHLNQLTMHTYILRLKTL